MKHCEVERLLNPSAWPHPTDQIRLLETHISWVILTGSFAYKIKKPVNFGFLDFSSLEKRRYYCEEELRLNRRYAAQLYVEVVSIGIAGHRVSVTASSDEKNSTKLEFEIFDYAVKMRQFDQSQLLSDIAERGDFNAALRRSLARAIAGYHQSFPALDQATSQTTIDAFHAAAKQNFQQIQGYPLKPYHRQKLRALADWLQRLLREKKSFMYGRAKDGFCKECHGDLHLGNMVLIKETPVFFDCIEFNSDFRNMDTIAEIAFTTMDLQSRSFAETAQSLLNDYLEYRGDYQGLEMLRCYRVYYALVRAKVNLLRHQDATDLYDSPAYAEFQRYLQQAHRDSRSAKVFLILMHGISGSGKSTVAQEVAAHSDAIRIRSDVERKRLFQLSPEASSHTRRDDNIYSKSASRATFDRLYTLSTAILKAGFPCIIDATFLHKSTRDRFLNLAKSMQVSALILSCGASDSCIRERLNQRKHSGSDASEADVTIMEQQVQYAEKFSPQELSYVLHVDTEKPQNWNALVRKILDRKD